MTVSRFFIFVLCAGWLLLGPQPARSQEELQPEEPARFLLETITIEGAQPAAARIIQAESLLEEGRTYTEDELRQAVYRIQRLPIVLESSFALRKGGTRGAYGLVIQVLQARRFFFDHSLRVSRFADPLALNDMHGDQASFSFPGLVGLRQFVGRTGVLFSALDSGEGVQVGYSQYDLFGRGIVASAAVSWNGGCCVTEVVPYGLDPGFTAWDITSQEKLALQLAVPMHGSRSVQLAFSSRRGEVGLRRRILEPDVTHTDLVYGEEIAEQRLTARWVSDTTDDPLLPTRGMSVSAGIEAGALAVHGLRQLRFGDETVLIVPQPDYEAATVSAVLTAARHWPVTPRQTLSASGRVSAGRSWLQNVQLPGRQLGEDIDADVYGVSAGVRHAVSLWRGRQPRGFGDLSLESTLEAGRETASPDLGISSTPLTRLEVSTGLVFRNQWGRLRLALAYLAFREDRR